MGIKPWMRFVHKKYVLKIISLQESALIAFEKLLKLDCGSQ